MLPQLGPAAEHATEVAWALHGRTSEKVPVSLFSSVDLPTDGNPACCPASETLNPQLTCVMDGTGHACASAPHFCRLPSYAERACGRSQQIITSKAHAALAESVEPPMTQVRPTYEPHARVPDLVDIKACTAARRVASKLRRLQEQPRIQFQAERSKTWSGPMLDLLACRASDEAQAAVLSNAGTGGRKGRSVSQAKATSQGRWCEAAPSPLPAPAPPPELGSSSSRRSFASLACGKQYA